jgi:hypothetical protein
MPEDSISLEPELFETVGFLDAEDKDDGLLFGVGGRLPNYKALQQKILYSFSCAGCLWTILYQINDLHLVFFSFLSWAETESTWYVGHKLTYCSSPG